MASPPDAWRTFSARLRREDYVYVSALLQRVADVERVRLGTALTLVLQDWLLAPEHRIYDPSLLDQRSGLPPEA